jgi:AcrR family transcriptional regulator
MVRNTRRTQRGEASLSRERIIEAAIALLDGSGEDGLTFRALSERLGTGAGAIYWHIADKNDLLSAACDAIVAPTMKTAVAGSAPREAIRAIGLGMFDAMDAHPWVGAALTRAPSRMPMVRILESLGRQVVALGVPARARWQAGTALLHYILGVAGQNAANTRIAREQDLVRSDFLDTVAAEWAGLDPEEFAFTRSIAPQLRDHDDRADFLAGIDLILDGIAGMPADPA